MRILIDFFCFSIAVKQFPAKKVKTIFEPTIKVEGLRNRKRVTSAESAIELKEKRSRTQVHTPRDYV